MEVKNEIVSQLPYAKRDEQKFVSLHSETLTNIQGFRGICLHISVIPTNASQRGFQDRVYQTGVKGTRVDVKTVIPARAFTRLPES